MPSFEFLSYLKDLEGAQLVVFLAVVMVFFLAVMVRFLFVSGKVKFDADQEDKQSALAIMQGQLEEMRTEIAGLKREIHVMAENEQYNREYRHALANQNQILLANCEVITELARDMARDWETIPHHFKSRLERIKTPIELLKSCPLPEPRFPT